MGINAPQITQSDDALLAWLDTAIKSGLAILKNEPAYQTINDCLGTINGGTGGLKQQALSRVSFNRTRKNLYEVVSAMSSVRPIWNYQTFNNSYKEQADILNRLVRSWWRTTYSDRKLQDALMFSGVGGTGYLKVEWNPSLTHGGNIDLIPLDTRDVIPINPAGSNSVQQWEGVAVRKQISLPELRNRYPDKFYRYKTVSKVWFEAKKLVGQGNRNVDVISPVLERLFSGKEAGSASSTVDLAHVFVKDDSIHTGVERKLMGYPGTNWCYYVYPVGSINPITGKRTTEQDARLYPRGRLIICTPECVLEDIPNPYWHGMFPVVKFTLDPQPWTLLGSSMVADGLSMQESLNEVLRGVEDCVKQWLRRTVVADKNAISRAMLNRVDSRVAGQKLNLNPTAGEGLKFIDGPQLPGYVMEYVRFLLDGLDDNYGVRGLQELAKLKQMPSADVIEKFTDAQTQLLQLRSMQMEQALAELAEMVKSLVFQYYDAPRRVQILGKDGLTMDDFDFNPNSLVPALKPADPGYKPELDVNLTTQLERAQAHQKNFVFSVARNSMLNASHTQQKMFYLQLARMPNAPLVDPWTLLSAFDVPNIGPEPEGSVFDKIRIAQALGIYPPSAQMQMQMQAQQGGPPGGGPPPSNAGPGRPPSGQEPPQMVNRTDPATGGPRQTVSESGR